MKFVWILCIPSIVFGFNKIRPHLPLPNKINEIVKLSRFDSNVAPITILSVLSGYVTNPTSMDVWIHSPPFLAAFTVVQCVSSASMILNDIQDIEIDRINNPQRPLVKGTILLSEAKALVCILFSISCYLSIRYLPPILDPFWTTSIGIITIYTPILKKIPFIKNLSCAVVVSNSVPFLGLATINPTLSEFPDLHIMFFTWQILFFSSLYIEILLDISDKVGDEKMGIRTLPVILGEKYSLLLLNIIISAGYINLFMNGLPPISLFATACPMYYNLYNVYVNKYSKQSIRSAVKQLTVVMLAYFVTLTFYTYPVT